MTTAKCQRGFTLIELLSVIGIIAVVGASASPFISRFILQNNLETTTDKVIGSIRKAQNYAMDGKNNWSWGVCITGSNLRLFGGVSSPTCTTNDFTEDFIISGSVSVSGLNETVFSKLRGEPNPSNGLSSVSIQTSIGSNTISVNSAGGVDVN